MEPQAIIPVTDPIPLPAPYWLFKLLLVLTFILHIVAMNFLLGGGILAAFARFFAKGRENYLLLANDTAKKLPAFFAATITLGIAPLLFLQVLYGQYFYTSSIIMAWPWLLVLALITLAYYGLYLVAFKNTGTSQAFSWALLVSMVLIFVVGFLYSNNFTLMQTPAKWASKYFADSSGWNLNWGDRTLIPRFLHFFVAALAVGGLMVAGVGFFQWKKDASRARFLMQYGGKWFMFATMAQFLVGIWFLVSLPREKMLLFMGDNLLATVAIFIGIGGGLAAIFIMSSALRQEDPRKGIAAAMALTAIVIVFMAIMRDVLRDAYLQAYFQPSNFAIKTQWDVLILFLVLFIAGVALWLVMIRRYFFSPASKAAS
ncbi:MAG: hypothetical protein D6814_08805 [Calditrichaeota bacterium]|nr:MAG: hypothetical protein D6814_08805 [Calditrichota bacterium]